MRSIPGEQAAADALSGRAPRRLSAARRHRSLAGRRARGQSFLARHSISRPQFERCAGNLTTAAALTIDVGLEPLHGPLDGRIMVGERACPHWPMVRSLGQRQPGALSRTTNITCSRSSSWTSASMAAFCRQRSASTRRCAGSSSSPAFLTCCACGITWTRSTRAPATWNAIASSASGAGAAWANVTQSYPSATAIGRHHSDHLLQVFWLAGTAPGQALENPRQVSAYQYPRVHGPVSPTFARALVAPRRHVADLRHRQHRRPCVASISTMRWRNSKRRCATWRRSTHMSATAAPRQQGFAQGVCARSRA